MTEPQKLAAGALGTSESIIMGVAGTAPAFSVAITTATLVAAVGVLSPGSILYCGLIMFGVTLAFMHLNRTEANAGGCYAWVGRIFSPILGFFAGWALLVASAIFMVSGTTPAATATLQLLISLGAVDAARIDDPIWVNAVASGWLVAVSAIIVKGIKPTSYTQIIMTGIEVLGLAALIIAAFVEYGSHPAHQLDSAWFSAASFSPDTFATGALTALFFFWGWDVTVNLNEETRDAQRSAGRGALWSMLIVMALFVSFVTAVLLVLSDAEIDAAGTNIVFVLATKLFPGRFTYIAIIAVMLSTIGTLETSILQFSRTLFAKGRDGVLHPRYAQLHRQWQTPWLATLVIALLGLLFLFLSSFIPTMTEIIKDSVNAIGFQVCFYYSLAGFACAWHYRQDARAGPLQFMLMFAWPLASALFLVFIGLYSVPTFDLTAKVVGIGGIAVGVVPWLANRLRSRRGSVATA
jgi:amino acid transporter